MAKANKSGKSAPTPTPEAEADKWDVDRKALTTVARIIASALALGGGVWFAIDPGAGWDALVWLEKLAAPSFGLASFIVVLCVLISMTVPIFMDLGMAGAALVGHWTVRPARLVLSMVLSALAGRRIDEETRDILGVALIVVWALLGWRGFNDMDTAKSRTYGREYVAREKAFLEADEKRDAERAMRAEAERAQNRLALAAAPAVAPVGPMAQAIQGAAGGPPPAAPAGGEGIGVRAENAGQAAVPVPQAESQQEKIGESVAPWFR
jgi:hypothetical protein